MPIITDISPQKKRSGYYNVFVDNKFAFGISDLQLSNLRLGIGLEYTSTELEEIKTKVVLSKAYFRALDYISRRRRSEWEIRDYLRRKEIEPMHIDQVVRQLIEGGYINDAEFARAWVADRNMMKPRSKRQLTAELIKKRIDREIITAVLDSQDSSVELDNLRLVATKKMSRYRDKNKLTNYLVGQGFRYADVRGVVDELMAENDKLGSNTDN